MCHNDLFLCQYRANVYFSGETGVTQSVLMLGGAEKGSSCGPEGGASFVLTVVVRSCEVAK